jgi:uncharacterized membrane protein YfcA
VDLTALDLTLVAIAALAGGAVNAIAGGGTLITFPALLATGVPPVIANATNTVALSPGYLGGRTRSVGPGGATGALLVPVAVLGA